MVGEGDMCYTFNNIFLKVVICGCCTFPRNCIHRCCMSFLEMLFMDILPSPEIHFMDVISFFGILFVDSVLYFGYNLCLNHLPCRRTLEHGSTLISSSKLPLVQLMKKNCISINLCFMFLKFWVCNVIIGKLINVFSRLNESHS